MQLLQDRQANRINENDYARMLKYINLKQEANKELLKQPKKTLRKRKKTPLTDTERKLRSALRPFVKWFFDGELHRDITPLFVGAGTSETMVKPLFATIRKEVVKWSSTNPIVASTICRATVS